MKKIGIYLVLHKNLIVIGNTYALIMKINKKYGKSIIYVYMMYYISYMYILLLL